MYIKVSLNEQGTVYCVVVPDGATAPTPAQVKAGQDGSGAPTTLKANGAANDSGISTLKITGLVYSTDYNAYCVAEDTAASLQAAVTERDVSTGARDTIFVSKTGNDTNDGSIETPVQTIAEGMNKAVGSITQVYVSAGDYAESVTVKDGVSLYGGFFATDWSDRSFETSTDRDAAAYKTFIQGNPTITYGVTFAGTSTLEGFTIASQRTTNSHGVSVSNDGTATIRYNTIFGGSGSNESNGIIVSGGAALMIVEHNTINGGASTVSSSSGIYIETAADQIITDNTINGGSGANASRGIIITYPLQSTSIIARNSIDGGSNATNSYGISIQHYADATSLGVSIQGNYINAGDGYNAFGIRCYGSADGRAIEPVISNNVIEVVDSTWAYGIYFQDVDGTPLVYNNTIVVKAVTEQAYGIYSRGNASQPTTADVRNNIFIGEGTKDFALIELDANALSSDIMNNDIFGCETIISSNGTPYGTIAGLNSLRAGISGNIDDDPVLSASPDRNLTASSPTAVTQGGLDLSSVFTIDKAGTVRTAPWSIGAYERD